MTAASDHVFAYCRDASAEQAGGLRFPEIARPDLVWDSVTFTDEPLVQHDDGNWFVVLENECALGAEHGLMIVLQDGHRVVKVSGYDGHLTNRHAFADD